MTLSHPSPQPLLAPTASQPALHPLPLSLSPCSNPLPLSPSPRSPLQIGCLTLVSLRFPFGFTSISLRHHIDLTSVPHRFNFDVTSVSLRIHFGITSVSLRFHIDSTSISLRVSLRIHFGLTSVSDRFHFDFASISLWHPLRKPHAKRTPAGQFAPGAPRHQGNQRNPINPLKIKGKHINTHHNTSRNHQGSSTISQNHFSLDFAKKASTGNLG